MTIFKLSLTKCDPNAQLSLEDLKCCIGVNQASSIKNKYDGIRNDGACLAMDIMRDR